MTKKDFQVIAMAIASAPCSFHDGPERQIEQRREWAAHMAKALADTNTRFDCDKFMAACMAGDDT